MPEAGKERNVGCLGFPEDLFGKTAIIIAKYSADKATIKHAFTVLFNPDEHQDTWNY